MSKPPSHSAASEREAFFLRADLAAFHAVVVTWASIPLALPPSAPSVEPVSWRLEQTSGWRPHHEVAWALSHDRFTRRTPEPSPEAGDTPPGTPEDAGLEAAASWLAISLPDPLAFLAHLEAFPPGAALAAYRQERLEAARSWVAWIHPEPHILGAYLLADPLLPPPSARAIAAHVLGPYHCFPCRRWLEAHRPRSSSLRWAPTARWAAASAANDVGGEWPLRLRPPGPASEAREIDVQVSFVNDGGFLHLLARASERLPRGVLLDLQLLFRDGQVLKEEALPLERAVQGVNLGPLDGRPAEGLLGISLAPTARRNP